MADKIFPTGFSNLSAVARTTTLLGDDGSTNGLLTPGDILDLDSLNANTTVNLTSAMTATAIQALIDAQPKNLNGFTLTFQFADGTYTLDTRLEATEFYGGDLLFNGNIGEAVNLHTNQAVILDFTTATGAGGFLLERNTCAMCEFRNLRIQVDSSSDHSSIYAYKNGPMQVNGCYFEGNSTTLGSAVKFYRGNGTVTLNYVSNTRELVYAAEGVVTAAGNSNTGTAPLYAYRAGNCVMNVDMSSDSITPSVQDLIAVTGGAFSPPISIAYVQDQNILRKDQILDLGPTLNTDTSLTGNGYFLDEDTMSSDDATKVASQQSIKAYVDNLNVASYSSSQALTAAECHGYVIYVTGAATITLPAIASGMSVTIITIGAVAVSIDPNASDLIYLDGTALDDGDKITNTSTAGDIATLTYYSADGWYAATNGWSDGGA